MMFFIPQTALKFQKSVKALSIIPFYVRFIQTSYLPNYSNTCIPSYFSSSDLKTVHVLREHFKLYENFISIEEEEQLLIEIDPILKRRRYEKDHWDDAIKSYKETEKSQWNESNSKVLERLRNIAFSDKSSLIRSVHVLDLSKDGYIKPHIDSVRMLERLGNIDFSDKSSLIRSVHVLDLSKEGYIKPHIDSVRFCGDTIAGLSLLSDSVMRLAMENQKSMFVDVLLPRRSLYVMKGVARYKFTHEILEDSISYFKGKQVKRDRRISVICRNEPVENIS